MDTSLIDFTPLVGMFLDGLFTALLGGAVYLGRRGLAAFEEKTGLQFDDQMKARVDDAIMHGVEYAKTKVKLMTPKEIVYNPRSAAVGIAADYVIESVPSALAYFGVTQDALLDKIEARLGIDLDLDGDIGGKPIVDPYKSAHENAA
ncbi:hypothetical protein ACQU0X_01090 [Pseudovibrio ascidiaceicola]|uniref:hypothetical protein n=1 Tax=Pseudovibrio ascidiaceicola TaxID=285279 RepID=UPI003D368946